MWGWGAQWRNLANTAEPSMCGGDVACYQITLTCLTWRRHYTIANVVCAYRISLSLLCNASETAELTVQLFSPPGRAIILFFCTKDHGKILMRLNLNGFVMHSRSVEKFTVLNQQPE